LVQVWAKSHGHVEVAYITAGGCLVSFAVRRWISAVTSLFIPIFFPSAMATHAHHDILDEKAYAKHEEFLAGVPGEPNVLTPDELVIEKKLRRKIDFLIMPLVILVYLMNYIDR
jgi:hypothetical protein